MSVLRLSKAAISSGRFAAVRSLYPRAKVDFTLVQDEPGLFVVKATLCRWPGDPSPAVAHAASALAHNTDVEWRWTCGFTDVRDAALDRACQNLWLPVALSGPSPAELWKAQHAALAWLWQRARKERTWVEDRVATYRYLAGAVGFPDERIQARFEQVLSLPEPAPGVLAGMVEYLGARADAMGRLVNLPQHLYTPAPTSGHPRRPDLYPSALSLKKALYDLYPEATIQTECLRLREGSVVMQAHVCLAPGEGPVGGGFDMLVRGKGPHLLNLASVESCESRAIADLLSKLGIRADAASLVASPAVQDELTALLEAAEGDPEGKARIERRAETGGFTSEQIATLSQIYTSGHTVGADLELILRTPALRPKQGGADPSPTIAGDPVSLTLNSSTVAA